MGLIWVQTVHKSYQQVALEGKELRGIPGLVVQSDSKLDYGCIIYGSARKSYLQMLDPIHNQGLRLALGAFRTSPVASLYVEADEPSLY